MKRTFTVVLERGDDGWWVAHAPLLHATAQGKSRAVALRRIQSVIEFALDDLRASGQPVPSEQSRVEVVWRRRRRGLGLSENQAAISPASYPRNAQTSS